MPKQTSSATPEIDDSVASLVGHLQALPEVFGRGVIPLDVDELKKAAVFILPRAISRARGGADDAFQALTYVSAKLRDAIAGDCDAAFLRLGVWIALREWAGLDSVAAEMLSVVVAWNAAQAGRPKLQVGVKGSGRKRTYDRRALARAIVSRNPEAGRHAELVPIDEVPISALANVMGYVAADSAC